MLKHPREFNVYVNTQITEAIALSDIAKVRSILLLNHKGITINLIPYVFHAFKAYNKKNSILVTEIIFKIGCITYESYINHKVYSYEHLCYFIIDIEHMVKHLRDKNLQSYLLQTITLFREINIHELSNEYITPIIQHLHVYYLYCQHQNIKQPMYHIYFNMLRCIKLPDASLDFIELALYDARYKWILGLSDTVEEIFTPVELSHNMINAINLARNINNILHWQEHAFPKPVPIHYRIINILKKYLYHTSNNNSKDVAILLRDPDDAKLSFPMHDIFPNQFFWHVIIQPDTENILNLLTQPYGQENILPFWQLIQQKNHLTPKAIAALLHYIEPNPTTFLKDNMQQYLPLHYAVLCDSSKAVKTLAKKAADLESQDKENNTPLIMASYNGYLKIVETLVEMGANVNCISEGIYVTAVYAAVEGQHLEVVRYLIKHGANVNIARYDNATCLHAAVASGQDQIVKLLLDSGANVNTRKTNSYKALPIELYNIYNRAITKQSNYNLTLSLLEHGSRVTNKLTKYCPINIILKNHSDHHFQELIRCKFSLSFEQQDALHVYYLECKEKHLKPQFAKFIDKLKKCITISQGIDIFFYLVSCKKIETFLLGSHNNSGSPIVILPEDVLRIILDHYSSAEQNTEHDDKARKFISLVQKIMQEIHGTNPVLL